MAGFSARITGMSGRTLWTPLNDPNAVAWFDANRADSMTFGTGSNVSAWYNIIDGKTTNVVQSTASKQPERLLNTAGTGGNGNYYVLFDGVDDILQGTTRFGLGVNPAYTVIGFWEINSQDQAVERVFQIGNDRGSLSWANGTDRASVRHNDGANKFATVSNTYHIQAWQAPLNGNYGSSTYYLDGTNVAVSQTIQGNKNPSDNTANVVIGGGNNTFAGSLEETLFHGEIYDLCLSEDDSQTTRELYEGFLAHKHNFASSLPALHPYKSEPPQYIPGEGLV